MNTITKISVGLLVIVFSFGCEGAQGEPDVDSSSSQRVADDDNSTATLDNALEKKPRGVLAYAPPRGALGSDGCKGGVDCRVLVDACWLTSQAVDFVGIAKVVSVSDRMETTSCDPDAFATDYWVAQVEVVDRFVGKSLEKSETVQAVFLTKGYREIRFQKDDEILVSMRKSGNEWIGLGYVYVLDGIEYATQPSQSHRISLPSSRGELASRLQGVRANFANLCPDKAQYIMSDKEFEAWTHGTMMRCEQPTQSSGNEPSQPLHVPGEVTDEDS